LGGLRLRTVATRDRPCHDFPDKGSDGAPDPAVVLDLDYTVFMPRRMG
jgi:2-methylfumaryl-CoA hydratase